MRTVRKTALGVFLLVAFALNSAAVASPVTHRGEDPLTRIKKLIVKVLDDVAIKIGLPPG